MSEDDILRKLQAILAKAENTDNPHEADTFFAKAQELMLRYAIDEARVREAQRKINGRALEDPILLDYMYSSYAHYAEAKADLLYAVARANSVKQIKYSNQKGSNDRLVAAAGLTGLYESQWTRLIGYKDDIEATKLMYLSLLIQSQRFAAEDWRSLNGDVKTAYDDDFGKIGKFAWIHTHMKGFASRIDTRFREMTERVYVEMPGSSALIVDKMANIVEWMYENSLARRPSPPPEQVTCYHYEEETDPTWPLTNAGTPNKKHRARFCLKRKWNVGSEKGQHIDGIEEHNVDGVPSKVRYSYSYSTAREESSTARNAGARAAERADIGYTRVGNRNAQLKG